MTLTHIITIIGFSLSAFVALGVAYLHRKQMRQIELFKQDPSVGLVPPPSALARFIKSKWDVIFAYGGPLYILGTELLKSAPVTRMTIALVSLSLVMLALNLVLALMLRLNSKFNERVAEILKLLDRQATITDKIIDRLPGEARV